MAIARLVGAIPTQTDDREGKRVWSSQMVSVFFFLEWDCGTVAGACSLPVVNAPQALRASAGDARLCASLVGRRPTLILPTLAVAFLVAFGVWNHGKSGE